jgi:biotin transporter BioY
MGFLVTYLICAVLCGAAGYKIDKATSSSNKPDWVYIGLCAIVVGFFLAVLSYTIISI